MPQQGGGYQVKRACKRWRPVSSARRERTPRRRSIAAPALPRSRRADVRALSRAPGAPGRAAAPRGSPNSTPTMYSPRALPSMPSMPARRSTSRSWSSVSSTPIRTVGVRVTATLAPSPRCRTWPPRLGRGEARCSPGAVAPHPRPSGVAAAQRAGDHVLRAVHVTGGGATVDLGEVRLGDPDGSGPDRHAQVVPQRIAGTLPSRFHEP